MRSLVAALRSLVLPWGHTTGPRIVIDGVQGAIQLYDAGGILRAEVALGVGPDALPGFAAYGLNGASYVAVADEEIQWGNTGVNPFGDPAISVTGLATAADPRTMILTPGRFAGASTAPLLRLIAQAGGRARAQLDALNGVSDLDVGGYVTAQNHQSGSASTAAPGVGGGTTTVNVVFATPFQAQPKIAITPRTTVDPATTTITGYVDAVTTAGFTIRAYRSTNSATAWMWQATD